MTVLSNATPGHVLYGEYDTETAARGGEFAQCIASD